MTTQRHARSCEGGTRKLRRRMRCARAAMPIEADANAIAHHETSKRLRDYGDGVLAAKHARLEERQPWDHAQNKDLRFAANITVVLSARAVARRVANTVAVITHATSPVQ